MAGIEVRSVLEFPDRGDDRVDCRTALCQHRVAGSEDLLQSRMGTGLTVLGQRSRPMTRATMDDEERLGALAERPEDGFWHVTFPSFVLSENILAYSFHRCNASHI